MKILAYKLGGEMVADSSLALSCLDKVEKARYEKIKSQKAKEHFLVGRVLMRRFMSCDLLGDENELNLVYGKRGKPYDAKLRAGGIEFNLSHSGDWVVLVYGESDSLGVDIERCREVDMSVAEKYFCKSECEYLNTESEDSLRDFFKLWTLKESYIKAIGEGLSVDLNTFGFCIKNDVKFYGDDIGSDLKFEFVNIDDQYELALCSGDGEAYEIEIIKQLFK